MKFLKKLKTKIVNLFARFKKNFVHDTPHDLVSGSVLGLSIGRFIVNILSAFGVFLANPLLSIIFFAWAGFDLYVHWKAYRCVLEVAKTRINTLLANKINNGKDGKAHVYPITNPSLAGV